MGGRRRGRRPRALVLYVPFLRRLFQFDTLHLIDLVICLVAGVGSISVVRGLEAVQALLPGTAVPAGPGGR